MEEELFELLEDLPEEVLSLDALVDDSADLPLVEGAALEEGVIAQPTAINGITNKVRRLKMFFIIFPFFVC